MIYSFNACTAKRRLFMDFFSVEDWDDIVVRVLKIWICLNTISMGDLWLVILSKAINFQVSYDKMKYYSVQLGGWVRCIVTMDGSLSLILIYRISF